MFFLYLHYEIDLTENLFTNCICQFYSKRELLHFFIFLLLSMSSNTNQPSTSLAVRMYIPFDYFTYENNWGRELYFRRGIIAKKRILWLAIGVTVVILVVVIPTVILLAMKEDHIQDTSTVPVNTVPVDTVPVSTVPVHTVPTTIGTRPDPLVTNGSFAKGKNIKDS